MLVTTYCQMQRISLPNGLENSCMRNGMHFRHQSVKQLHDETTAMYDPHVNPLAPSRISNRAVLIPHFSVAHFTPLHFERSCIFHSRIFSWPAQLKPNSITLSC